MFTGIVEKLGTIERADRDAGGMRLLIETRYPDLTLGESVAVNGVCLTVTERTDDGRALFFVSTESLDRTALGVLAAGARVNLERAVTMGTRLSGHLVQGHVDGVASVVSITRPGGAPSSKEGHCLEVALPEELARFCVEKGSIALNGTSLTINSLGLASGRPTVRIMVIPHTWEQTTFHLAKPGDPINVEVDVFAKYVERLCHPYLKPSRP